jgi:hypothetical protein
VVLKGCLILLILCLSGYIKIIPEATPSPPMPSKVIHRFFHRLQKLSTGCSQGIEVIHRFSTELSTGELRENLCGKIYTLGCGRIYTGSAQGVSQGVQVWAYVGPLEHHLSTLKHHTGTHRNHTGQPYIRYTLAAYECLWVDRKLQ